MLGLLGALHVFWALEGRLGVGSTIPEVDGRPAYSPSAAATFAVACALFAASVIVLGRADVLRTIVPARLFQWPVFVMGLVFLVRAIGEFRLVGFFKRVRGTSFARWDTWFFSPLCLGLSVASLWLAFR